MIQPAVIGDLLRRRASQTTAAVICANKAVTYAELDSAAASTAALLAERFGQGGQVGIFLPNGLNYVVGYFAAMYGGRTAVPLDPRMPELELCATIGYCEVPIILTDAGHLAGLLGSLSRLGRRIQVLTVDEGGWHVANAEAQPPETGHPVGGLRPDDVAVMLHTSGTTSRPKRVMLTHRNLLANVAASAGELGLGQEDTTLVVLPMYFGYCHNTQLLSHVMLGGTIVISDGEFRPRNFLKLIERHRITNTTLVPSLLHTLRHHSASDGTDVQSWNLALFGGGPMPVPALRDVQQRFPAVDFVQTYGQTEASPRVTSVPRGESRSRHGTVGLAIPGVRVSIRDEDGHQLMDGEVGQIVVSGHLMRGYYKRPADTAAALRHGVLWTGDVGRIDPEHGHLQIVGRLRNIIICSGQNIYPEQVEEILLSDPEVADAQVFGEPHLVLGEVPVARVVPRADAEVGDLLPRLRELCRAHLAAFKTPSRIDVVDELPKTVTGKTIRFHKEST